MKHFTKTAAGLAALVALIISAPANATLPTPADAISLKNAINNNTVAIAYLPGNSAIISTLLPKMGDCTAVFTVAKNNMDAEISYYAGGGRDVPTLNNYRAQVNSALAGGTACAVPPQTPGDVFNANGVKYTNIGYPSNSFVTALEIFIWYSG